MPDRPAATPGDPSRRDATAASVLLTDAFDAWPFQQVERRRRQLWAVAGVLLVAVSAAVALLFGDRADVLLLDMPALRWAFAAVTVAFLLYVVDQERLLRRLSRSAVAEHERFSALVGRLNALAALLDAARQVNAAEAPAEGLRALVDAALRLTCSDGGALLMRDGDDLSVRVSAGEVALPAGARVALGAVRIGAAAHHDRARIVGPGDDGSAGGTSSVIAPLLVGGSVVGVLTVDRGPGAPPFTPADVKLVELFAEHAATAIGAAGPRGPGRPHAVAG